MRGRMLDSAACRSKTARATVEAPCCGKSSRDKGLVQGRRARYLRAYEASRFGSLGWGLEMARVLRK